MKILHISDLHFHESTDGRRSRHRHSLACLRALDALVEEHRPTHLVVTGDITNIGDVLSLERAYQWIHDQIYSDGEYYGLRTDQRGIEALVVPGNHDAFNAPSTGAEYKRWQSSLTNFHDAFRSHRWQESNHGVKYSWQVREGIPVFFCLVDTCYLGDPETESLGASLSLDKIAKGRLSTKQSASILAMFDDGISGKLLDQAGNPIPGATFLSALKLLVMHHYLFEPSDSRAEPLLQLKQKRTVFQNMAMSDFDVLLCGHKHIADIRVSSYAEHFDRRGQVRLAMNYVRRVLGIRSLPLGDGDDGKKLSKALRLIVGFLAITRAKRQQLDSNSASEILKILEKSLENPMALKEEMVRYLNVRDDVGELPVFEKDEINELYARIRDRFDRSDRKALNDAARRVRGLLSHLSGRPFAHIMSGSSAKQSETEARSRAAGLYEVRKHADGTGYEFSATRYSWNPDTHSFVKAFEQSVMFPYSRGLHEAPPLV